MRLERNSSDEVIAFATATLGVPELRARVQVASPVGSGARSKRSSYTDTT